MAKFQEIEVTEEDVVIPYTGYRYWINSKRVVFDRLNGKVLPTCDKVEIDILGAIRLVDMDWLVATAFKPMHKAESFILNWTTIRIDPKSDDPDNLLWVPPKGGQECPEKEGYFIIPGYSKSAINVKGDVLYRVTGNIRSIEKRYGKKYLSLSLRGDNDIRETIPHHRAVGYALVPYDNRVRGLTINHKNGIKTDNHPDNLEWTTYGENNKHAMMTGLRDVYRRVSVKDHWENKTTVYISLSDCAEKMDMPGTGMIVLYATIRSHLLYKHRYSFVYENELSSKSHPVHDPEILKDRYRQDEERKKNFECAAYNIRTKQLIIAPDRKSMAKLLGLEKEHLRTALSGKYVVPQHGYLFSYLKDGKPLIREYEPEFIRDIGTLRGVRIIFRCVSKIDGQISYIFDKDKIVSGRRDPKTHYVTQIPLELKPTVNGPFQE